MKHRARLALIVAIALAGALWTGLRIGLEAKLAEAAQRDLQTIVELAASEIEAEAADLPQLRGIALARVAAGPATPLLRALRRAGAEQYRTVYFFDADGRLATAESAESAATAAASGGDEAVPAIVARALAALRTAPSEVRGSLVDPYADSHGDEVIGAWRWLPALGLGVVAERPYERFAAALDYIDFPFAILLAALVIAALLLGLPAGADLLAAFRRADIAECGPYRIERLLGEGTMSNVYLARHRHLDRLVALKRLKLQAQRDELAERFDREVRLASGLSHPNIITILDHGRTAEGGFYYTMEYIRGLTLSQWVEQYGPLHPARAVRLLRQIGAAVGAMHAAGLLHRDIKPDNVMAYAANGDWDLVKLLDFGLIKNIEGGESRNLTRNLRVLGTPAFMAPERLVDPRCIDPRTDIYGIGCIAFFLLAGRKPFEATADIDLVQQIRHVEAPPLAGLSPFALPPALTTLVAEMLAKDMNRRPDSAAELDAALAAIAATLPWQPGLARLWWQSAQPAADTASSRAATPAPR